MRSDLRAPHQQMCPFLLPVLAFFFTLYLFPARPFIVTLPGPCMLGLCGSPAHPPVFWSMIRMHMSSTVTMLHLFFPSLLGDISLILFFFEARPLLFVLFLRRPPVSSWTSAADSHPSDLPPLISFRLQTLLPSLFLRCDFPAHLPIELPCGSTALPAQAYKKQLFLIAPAPASLHAFPIDVCTVFEVVLTAPSHAQASGITGFLTPHMSLRPGPLLLSPRLLHRQTSPATFFGLCLIASLALFPPFRWFFQRFSSHLSHKAKDATHRRDPGVLFSSSLRTPW